MRITYKFNGFAQWIKSTDVFFTSISTEAFTQANTPRVIGVLSQARYGLEIRFHCPFKSNLNTSPLISES